MIDVTQCAREHAVRGKAFSPGPSFEAIAERYAGQEDALARLANQIVQVGAGSGGRAPCRLSPMELG